MKPLVPIFPYGTQLVDGVLVKAVERDKIADQTKEFLSNGGSIKEIPTGESGHSSNVKIDREPVRSDEL